MQRTARQTVGFTVGLFTVILLATALAPPRPGYGREYPQPVPAPPLTQQHPEAWINSVPLTWNQLRGKVVLIDFWTFGCWNCYRSFPWLNSVEQRFGGRGFVVLGVHTPEFEYEKDRAKVAGKTREFRLSHPVMMDNDYGYWRAIGNRYWPTFYLVDKQGRIRAHYIGETHAGDAQASAIEKQINDLLAE